jgi:anti-sigma28 factor (negative regulator of flagellin synthesis)
MNQKKRKGTTSHKERRKKKLNSTIVVTQQDSSNQWNNPSFQNFTEYNLKLLQLKIASGNFSIAHMCKYCKL